METAGGRAGDHARVDLKEQRKGSGWGAEEKRGGGGGGGLDTRGAEGSVINEGRNMGGAPGGWGGGGG